MNLEARAALVRQIRVEIKQDAAEQQRQRNAMRRVRRLDRNRPRLTRNSTEADRNSLRARVAAYEADRGRRGGFALGESLRQSREAGGFGIDPSSDTHAEMARRSNVRLIGRTAMTGQNPGNRGIVRTLTPSERVNQVGVNSRRRSTAASRAAADALYPAPTRSRRRGLFGN